MNDYTSGTARSNAVFSQPRLASIITSFTGVNLVLPSAIRPPLPACVKGAEFLVRQIHRSCANVLFEVRYLAGPRDRQDGRAASEHPRERDLTRTHTSFLGDAVDEGPVSSDAARNRKEGNTASIDKVEKVLDGRDPEESLCGPDLLGRLAQAGVTDQTFTLKLADGAKLLVPRHLRIEAVKLPEVDTFDRDAASSSRRIAADILGGPTGI